jgi:TolA-binding protein
MNIRRKDAKPGIPLLKHIIICGLTGLIFFSGCSSMAQSGAISHAQRSIGKGNYQSALAQLTSGESYTRPTPEVSAKINYMKGVCYEGLKKSGEAKAMFQFVADHFADTPYGYMAKEKLNNAK